MNDAPPFTAPGPAGVPVKTSGLAITSLVLGIVGALTGCIGIGVLIGLVAVVLGIVAMPQIARPENRLKGQGLAIAGTVLGGV